MDDQLINDLAANAAAWRHLSTSISDTEMDALDKVHHAFIEKYGTEATVRAYLKMVHFVLKDISSDERSKVVEALATAMTQVAIQETAR